MEDLRLILPFLPPDGDAVHQCFDFHKGQRIALENARIPYKLGQHPMEPEARSIYRIYGNCIWNAGSIPLKPKRFKNKAFCIGDMLIFFSRQNDSLRLCERQITKSGR